jgi:hypothetical protein
MQLATMHYAARLSSPGIKGARPAACPRACRAFRKRNPHPEPVSSASAEGASIATQAAVRRLVILGMVSLGRLAAPHPIS